MGYDRGDSFPFDFEPNGVPFGSKLKGKLSPRSYPIQFEKKWKYSFLSVHQMSFIPDPSKTPLPSNERKYGQCNEKKYFEKWVLRISYFTLHHKT